jgi:hypothetical protein
MWLAILIVGAFDTFVCPCPVDPPMRSSRESDGKMRIKMERIRLD